MLFMKEHSRRNGFMIKLDNIRKTYPGSAHAAIRGLNLVINSGELYFRWPQRVRKNNHSADD